MLKKDEDDVALPYLPYLMVPHIILTPSYRPPLSLERRGEGGEDRKDEGPGVRIERTATGFEIKK